MVYASKPGGVDTRSLITGLLARGTEVVVPIIEQDPRTLRLSCLRNPDAQAKHLLGGSDVRSPSVPSQSISSWCP